MDPISAADATLLRHDGPAHLHVGGVARFAGPAPTQAAVLAHVRARLDAVPRYRQRAVSAPGPLGRLAPPRWIDDPAFNLEYHVRHTALPAPGDQDRLRRLTARVFSQALDRTKPLWELWFVEGLEDDGWALIAKTHQALIDGVTGVALMSLLFDAEPEPAAAAELVPWAPRPEPSAAELTAGAVDALVARTLRGGVQLAAWRAARGAVGAVGGVLSSGVAPSALRVPLTPHRRVTDLSASLEDFKTVKNAFGATVNDVVLASLAGGLRHWLHARGQPTIGEAFTACVPVAVRDGEHQRVRQAFAPLPVTLDDPVARLEAVQTALADVKRTARALEADAIAEDFNAPTLLAQASRLALDPHAYDVLVTNIPGPAGPRWMLGRQLTSFVLLSFLAAGRALSVSCVSYGGAIHFGLLADLDAIADVEVIADGIRLALADLVAAS